MSHIIHTQQLEFTTSNYKFKTTIDNNAQASKTFNIRIDDERFKFQPTDLPYLQLLPKIVTAFMRAVYPSASVYIDTFVNNMEYNALEVITHLSRRVISQKIKYPITKSKITQWNIIPSNICFVGTVDNYEKNYNAVIPISGGRDSMLLRTLLEKGNYNIMDFIVNYGGYRWSLYEKHLANKTLPSVNINPIIVGSVFNATDKLYKPFMETTYDDWEIQIKWGENHIKDMYIDMYGFFNYVFGLVFASRTKGWFTPAIENPHMKYTEKDGVWAFMFDESQIAVEIMKDLCNANGLHNKIVSPIIHLNDVVEYKMLHDLSYEKYGHIITSCGFGKTKWCYRCHKDAQAYFRWSIIGIDPMLYDLDANKLAKHSEMIRATLDGYETYCNNRRRIVSNEEFGYLHFLLNTNKLNTLPTKIEKFLRFFPIVKSNKNILTIDKQFLTFIPKDFKYMRNYETEFYNVNTRLMSYKKFNKLSLIERIKLIAKIDNMKEHTLVKILNNIG